LRADRLLKLILALSDGRRRTAAQLADQLEVSERTIYRDLEALVEAGVPVRTIRGPDGGVELPREWRRLPTGLTTAEVAGLAVLTVPASLATLEDPLRTALAKVVAALPEPLRAQAEAARQRLLIDPSPWWTSAEAPPALDRLLDAVWGDRRVKLRYRDAQGRDSDPVVDALALVVKADRWYLVGGTDRGPRLYRGDRIAAAEVLDQRFDRPDVDLRALWVEHQRSFLRSRPSFPVRLRLTRSGQERLAAARPASERANILAADEVVVDFQRLDIALAQLAPLGAEARVLAPSELIVHLHDLARAWLLDAPTGG
jgi:predicted DNA-binding transcriptional regulator YafY